MAVASSRILLRGQRMPAGAGDFGGADLVDERAGPGYVKDSGTTTLQMNLEGQGIVEVAAAFRSPLANDSGRCSAWLHQTWTLEEAGVAVALLAVLLDALDRAGSHVREAQELVVSGQQVLTEGLPSDHDAAAAAAFLLENSHRPELCLHPAMSGLDSVHASGRVKE
jgi:hypothetical protein